MHALADCIKAIQGMTGKARTYQAVQDLQQIIDATRAHLQAHPNKFGETTTLASRNMQRVPRVQVPPSATTTNHSNDNRRIMRYMHPQPPVPRVPTNEHTSKPTSMPPMKTINKPTHAPTIKPTTLPAD
jgi:hypothetical protein